MKFRDYTYQTGNCVIHDTTTKINIETKSPIVELINRRNGELPFFDGVTYRITIEDDDDILMMMTVDYQDFPVWTMGVCRTQESIERLMELFTYLENGYQEQGISVDNEILKRKTNLVAPCNITFLHPSGIFVPMSTILHLSGVSNAFAGAILEENTQRC